MKLVNYRTQEGDSTGTMLPSGSHVVDKHGTIHSRRVKISKKQRNRLKKQVRGE